MMSNFTSQLELINERLLAIETENEELKSSINVSFLAISAFLIMFMQAGFALVEAGSVTKRNIVEITLKNVLDVCLGAVVYWLVGFSFAFGDAEPKNGFIGHGYFASKDMPGTFNFTFWLFQFAFAATSTTIVSGAIAERLKFQGYLLHSAVMTGFIYPVVSHWIWSSDGWLYSGVPKDALFGVGVIDFAGGAVVHLVGGASSIVASKFVGYRNQYCDINDDKHKPRFQKGSDGKFIVNDLPSSSPILATLGTFILWFGWYGFNCGSVVTIVGHVDTMSRVAINTTLSAGTAAITALLYGRWERRELEGAKWSLLDAANGILAGLASVTACCAFVDVWAAFIIGAVGAIIFKTLSALLLHPKIQVDDPVDAFPVHAGCGSWGIIAASLFARSSYVAAAYASTDDFKDGLFFGHGARLGLHIIALIIVFLWSASFTLLTFGFMWFVDRNRKDTFFFERGNGRQELAFGRAAEQIQSTAGFINPDIGANLELGEVEPEVNPDDITQKPTQLYHDSSYTISE